MSENFQVIQVNTMEYVSGGEVNILNMQYLFFLPEALSVFQPRGPASK